ncbi:hypothetical protein UFOVP242_227 [uncultured Caudovirales phage]|uniref:Restriction alleviation protein, Lar family n=1 Tax=uncultured Caudovirales phage TaxID=2100421 RepID=A0A6J7X407_9CAUD|nr:hypothetical protein UFOVP242_227 [uncultured Caudovirales phage]
MIEDYELLDCPFCDGEAKFSFNLDEDIWTHNTVKWYKVGCPVCEIYTSSWPESVAKEEVIDVWNCRVNE